MPRLSELVAKADTGSAEDLVAAVLDDLNRFRAGTPQDDDVTLVALLVDQYDDVRLSA